MKPSLATDFDDPLPAAGEDSRRALALLWLADATPLTAAPQDALTNIRSRLSLNGEPVRRRAWRALAVAGWAAAACLAVLLWRRPAGSSTLFPDAATPDSITRQKPKAAPRPDNSGPPASPTPEDGMLQPLTDPAAVRRQLAELRSALEAAALPAPGIHRPVIRELRPPGSTAPAASHDRILDLIAIALESDLRRRSAASDGRELIIESGWANWSTSLPAATTFRHRRFPLDRWAELGLQKGAGGQFFDPATGWLWSPDPDSTDYIGRAASADLDRNLFAGPDKDEPEKMQAAAISPAGYLLTGADGQTIVALSNLPAVPRGSSLSMTSFGVNGNAVRYGLSSTAASTAGGWNFSGIIPANADADPVRGFSIQLQDTSGVSSVILSTGGAP